MRARAAALALAAGLAVVVGAAGASAADVDLEGRREQGGMMLGRVAPGSTVTLDGRAVRLAPDGRFVIGFGRDHGPEATLVVRAPDGAVTRTAIAVAPRTYEVQRIDGLPPAQVTPDPAALARIAAEREKVLAVRMNDAPAEDFAAPFRWPAQGRISGVYGSQRILNGEPRQPHFGIDIAAPVGTPVVACAPGTVTMAEPDLYFTGGTLAIDHGHGLVSIYSHLASVEVPVGARVAAGERVGTIGATGRATGPHLDWRVSWFDQRLDPAFLVPPMPAVAAPAAPAGPAGE